MLHVIDVYKCYVRVLSLNRDEMAPALGCDVRVDDGGCEGVVNDSNTVRAGHYVGVPRELFVVNNVSVCFLVHMWGFLQCEYVDVHFSQYV